LEEIMFQSASFPNTDWKLIERAGAAGTLPQREALQTLLVQYMPALTAHLLSNWRVRLDEAEELLQAFLAAKVVEGNLIGQVRQEKGRFRNFVRSTLDAFVVSQRRWESAKKRAPARMEGLDLAQLAEEEGADPHTAFEVVWAKEVIAAAVEATGRELRASGRPDLWGVFETRILTPILEGRPPMAYEELVRQFNFRSPIQAANALTTAKRAFERNLRAILRQYVTDGGEIEKEIGELRTILAGSRA
jgi:hypothetical protein